MLVAAAAFAYRRLFLFNPGLNDPTEIEPFEAWFFSPSGASPLLIYALTGWFTIRRALGLPGESAGPGPAATALGVAGVMAAAGLVLWGHYTSAFQVLAPSLAIGLVSAGLLLRGLEGGRALLMPAGFLTLLGTPIPPPLLNAILYPMQIWTAEVATEVVRLLGYAAQQSGDQIVTSWATFQVIETCAGLRAIQTLLMAAFVYGELVGLRRRRRLILILMAPAIGIAVNLGRVLLLVFKPVPESQPEHSMQGVLMLIVGVVLLWGLDEAMDRIAKGRDAEDGDPETRGEGHRVEGRLSLWRMSGLTGLLVVTGVWSSLLEPWTPTSLPGSDVHAIPRELGQWVTDQEPLAVDREYLGSVRFSSRTWRRYQRGDESVTLFIGANDRLRRDRSLVSDKTVTLESGSFVVGEPLGIADSDASGLEKLVQVRTREGQTLLVRHGYQNTSGLWVETFRSAFGLDRGPKRRTLPARVLRIATPLEPSPGGLDRARRRLEAFSALVHDEIEKLPTDG